MVRILEVKELAKKKKELTARSEIYRQTLVLEATNIKLSVSLLKKRMRALKVVYRLLGWSVPVSGLLFGAKNESPKQGLIAQFLTGFSLASRIKSLFSWGKTAEPQPDEAKESSRI